MAASPHLSETDISTSDFSTKEFVAGLSIAMGNPKTILFYASILPSFVDLTNSNIIDYMICLWIVGISTALVLSMYAVIGYWMRAHIVSRYIEQWAKKIAGCFFVSMSLYLIYLFSTSL